MQRTLGLGQLQRRSDQPSAHTSYGVSFRAALTTVMAPLYYLKRPYYLRVAVLLEYLVPLAMSLCHPLSLTLFPLCGYFFLVFTGKPAAHVLYLVRRGTFRDILSFTHTRHFSKIDIISVLGTQAASRWP